MHGDGDLPGGGILRAGDCEQAVDQPGQPGVLRLRASGLGAVVLIGVLGQQVEPQAERGQRGAELVGDVGHHRLVAIDERQDDHAVAVSRHGDTRRTRSANSQRAGRQPRLNLKLRIPRDHGDGLSQPVIHCP
jgi:hypothetical protein